MTVIWGEEKKKMKERRKQNSNKNGYWSANTEKRKFRTIEWMSEKKTKNWVNKWKEQEEDE